MIEQKSLKITFTDDFIEVVKNSNYYLDRDPDFKKILASAILKDARLSKAKYQSSIRARYMYSFYTRARQLKELEEEENDTIAKARDLQTTSTG